MGHGLGSVVTMKLALAGGYNAAILEAGYPDTGDLASLPGLRGMPTLSLAGSSDCSAKLADVQKGWGSLAPPSALVVLDGVTHYQFTDSQAEDEAKCAPTAKLEDAHAEMEQAMISFLSAALTDAGVNGPELELVPNATVETK